MFTQCSKCETVFKLSAEVLRAAAGQVRCGRCGEVFNALARLAEDSTAFATGESPLDLEARADSILESTAALQPAAAAADISEDFATPGVEIAQLEVLDWEKEERPGISDLDTPGAGGPDVGAEDGILDALADYSMEFTLPPGELDRIFVEPKPRVPHPPLAAAAEPEPSPQTDAVTAVDTRSSLSGIEVPDDIRREMLAEFEQGIQPENAARHARHWPFIFWLSAAIASTVLLIAQVVHQNPAWSAASGPFGVGMRALYSALGAAVPAPANLSAYELRQWGVTGDPDANGTLRVRASILNTAGELQPYPLLRVTLANRFGGSVGARDFEPAEYLGKPTARLLAPGERIDVTLEILDPGKNAEGFEIDVCLRGADRKISCANDAAPQAKR